MVALWVTCIEYATYMSSLNASYVLQECKCECKIIVHVLKIFVSLCLFL